LPCTMAATADTRRPGHLVIPRKAKQDDSSECGASSPERSSPSCSPKLKVRNPTSKSREIAELVPPSVIGDFYDFGHVLGAGAFGTVKEILHSKTFETFAGKLLHKADVKSQERIVMETLLNCAHDSLLRYVHIFEDAEFFYIVMPKAVGGDVRGVCGLFGTEQYTVAWLTSVAGQLFDALHYLFGKCNLIHRDIKPENLLFLDEAQQSICIADFDMAVVAGSEGYVKCSGASGTAGYLAPECLREFRYSSSSDIFAMAVAIVVVISGESPCKGVSKLSSSETEKECELMLTWISRVRDSLTVATQPFHGIPVEMAEVLSVCLSPTLEERPRSARDVLRTGWLAGTTAGRSKKRAGSRRTVLSP